MSPPKKNGAALGRRKALWAALGVTGAGILVFLLHSTKPKGTPIDNTVSLETDRLINQRVAEMEILKLPWTDPRRQAMEMSLEARALPKIFEDRLSGLFDRLGVSGNERIALIDMLVEREVMKDNALYPERGSEVVVQVPSSFPIKIPGGAISTHKSPPPEDYAERVAAAVAPAEAKIEKLLGKEKSDACLSYLDTAQLRDGIVTQLQDALKTAKKKSMDEEQIEKLLAWLSLSNPPERLYRLDKVTPDVVQAAQSFLDPDQAAMLDRIQQTNAAVEDFVDKAIEAGNYTPVR